jgi:hypothetical protein
MKRHQTFLAAHAGRQPSIKSSCSLGGPQHLPQSNQRFAHGNSSLIRLTRAASAEHLCKLRSSAKKWPWIKPRARHHRADRLPQHA